MPPKRPTACVKGAPNHRINRKTVVLPLGTAKWRNRFSSMPDLPSSAGTITVLSLNLRFGLADDGPNAWPKRKPALLELLQRQPADFFCFQEANDFQISEIQAHLQNHDVIGQRTPAPPFWQNNVIFYHSSCRCVDRNHFFLSPTPTVPSRFRDSRWPRQCSIGWFQCRGRTIACANTHLDFDPEVQRRSAAIILDHLSTPRADVPTLVAGDFNATPQSECYRVFAEAGFQKAGPRKCAGTYHGFTGKTNGECIDWILYRGGLVSVRTEVIRDCYKGRYPSDHFPVRAEFSWSD